MGPGWGLVLQDALTSLDPVRPVGAEIAEAVRNHRVVARREVATRVRQLLADAQVPQPDLRARQYPHQLSGGLRQRALIAAAMAADPPVLVADEPTTALDVTVQARVLDLLAARKSAGTAVLLISHDLSVVARLADRVAVLHDGVVVETGETAELLRAPTHPYTRRLLAATPTAHLRGARLAGPRTTPVRTRSPRPTGVVAEVRAVSKLFRGPDRQPHRAVSGVSFTLSAGEILGVVGESGSGKTTAGAPVVGPVESESGTIELFGRPWSGVPESRRRRGRCSGCCRTRWVRPRPADRCRAVSEPLIVQEAVADRAARARARELLDGRSGPGSWRPPPADLLRRTAAAGRDRPGARPDTEVIVCDEPVSALDVSVQAQILDLFTDIRADLGTAIVLISHDLGVVHHVADRVLVMRDGKVVESGQVTEVFARPAHPYTRELVGALPRPEDAYAGQPEGVT